MIHPSEITYIQALPSFAVGENALNGCDQPIKFDRFGVELVAPRRERLFAFTLRACLQRKALWSRCCFHSLITSGFFCAGRRMRSTWSDGLRSEAVSRNLVGVEAVTAAGLHSLGKLWMNAVWLPPQRGGSKLGLEVTAKMASP